jgi:AraC family transcriptional regulator, regulatory protein of adaptative response / methylated-DNA-[protein]-cysteine methyltransferase
MVALRANATSNLERAIRIKEHPVSTSLVDFARHNEAPRAGTAPVSRDDIFWRSVLEHDRAADGAFVYAVRSTGVYCRPSCPSRRPQRRQVLFFPLPEAAERKGFRECERCKPRSATTRDPKIDVVARVCREIDARLANDGASSDNSRITLSALASHARMSPHQLERSFRGIMGITPRQYADERRMRRLKSQLKNGHDVTTALYDAGFSSSSRLYERAHGQLGMTPATYQRGGRGMSIHYTVSGSPLGRLLVAATERGISALYLGESDAPLEAALKKEYPRADIHRDKSGLGPWLSKILEHLRGREPHLDLPTDIQATAFQRRVWEELRRIPYGTTKTYTEVARAIGHPRAVRAVARACATNPVSVVVPCHRVVREDGKLAGYRWGLERKQKLLEHEQMAAKHAGK